MTTTGSGRPSRPPVVSCGIIATAVPPLRPRPGRHETVRIIAVATADPCAATAVLAAARRPVGARTRSRRGATARWPGGSHRTRDVSRLGRLDPFLFEFDQAAE